MIPKIWCWIFGHTRTYQIFSGKTATLSNSLTGAPMEVPIMSGERKYKDCPRCGGKV